jgi:hypothetical protein
MKTPPPISVKITAGTAFFRHPGESLGPGTYWKYWIPAFAGMTNATPFGFNVTLMPTQKVSGREPARGTSIMVDVLVEFASKHFRNIEEDSGKSLGARSQKQQCFL